MSTYHVGAQCRSCTGLALRLRCLLALMLILLIPGCGSSNGPSPLSNAAVPNFLFVITDDQSWIHTSRAGYELVSTPHFDKLANEGVYFNNAFVSAPSCTPSRAAVLAGQDFWRLGSAGLLWGAYSDMMISYQQILKEAGYATGFTGKGWGPGVILNPFTEPTGDDYNEIKRPETVALEPYDLAANFEQFLDDKSSGQPFSFWVGPIEPHRPFPDVPNRFTPDTLATGIPAIMPPTITVQNQLSSYLSEIEYFDNDLGLLVQVLKKRGLLDNTIIVVTSDNGMEFSRGKPTLYQYGVRVPLAIYWNKIGYPGRTLDDFVSLIDIAPTFLAAAGVDIPEVMTGRSLLPLLESPADGQVDPERDAVFVGYERHAGGIREGDLSYSSRGVYTHDFTYIRNRFPDRWPVGDPPRFVEAIPWLLMDPQSGQFIEPYFSLVAAKRPAEELYNLRVDPLQLVNVAQDPDYRDVLAALRLRLTDYLVKTEDPVELTGEDIFSTFKYYGKN